MRYLTKENSITDIANIIFPIFLIITTGIICYSGTFDVPFIFDDLPSIVSNDSIKDLYGLKAIWEYNRLRFVAFFSFAINYHIHGFNLFGYHLINLIIHIFAALTVYWLIILIFQTPELKKNPLALLGKPLALAVAMIFVTHPVETQAVTYIVQRMTSMASWFYLLSLVLYIRARIYYDAGNPTHFFLYAGSITAALLAMFTKEISVTLPLCILVIEYFFFSPCFKKLYRKITYIWPMLLTIPGVIATYMLSNREMIKNDGLAAVAALATETDTISRVNYLLTQFNVISTYLKLLFFPSRQSIDYNYPIAKNLFDLNSFASFLLLLSIFVLSLLVFKKFRLISFGIVWFYLTLMVESSVIPIRDVIFEHRLYLPSIGIFLSATVFIFYLFGNKRRILFIFFALIISLSSLATINRNIVWKKQVLIWHDAIAKKNITARTMNNLGVGFINLGRLDLAIHYYDMAAKKFPKHAKLYFNRGIAHHMIGNLKEAIEDYTGSIALYPKYHRTYFCRGMAFIQLGQIEQALEDMNKAINIKDDAIVYYNRSCIYLLKGSIENALNDTNRAIELDKDNPLYYRNRALIFYRLKVYDKALKDLDKALQINPDFLDALVLRDKILEQ